MNRTNAAKTAMPVPKNGSQSSPQPNPRSYPAIWARPKSPDNAKNLRTDRGMYTNAYISPYRLGWARFIETHFVMRYNMRMQRRPEET